MEHRRKLSEALKGRGPSRQHIEMLRQLNTGRKHAEAVKARISATRIARGLGSAYGAANPRWKGGVRYVKGYRLLLRPDHPNAMKSGYVAEHILVMAEHLGRPIDTKTELVHHKDENKLNNTLDNLEVQTRAQHASHHHKGLIKPNSIANLKPRPPKTPRVCPQCHKPFIYGSKKAQLCCSKRCATFFRYAIN